MTTVIIIGIIILILYLASSKSKPKSISQTYSKSKMESLENENEEGQEFAKKHFGDGWYSFLSGKINSFSIPKEFHKTIALAYSKLTPQEKKELLLTFSSVNSNSNSNSGIIMPVGFNNFSSLHSATIELLQKDKFSVSNMENLFKQLIENKKRKLQEKQKQEKDESIIDVTGNSYSIKGDNNSVVSYENGVPLWPHHYVYSHTELNNATQEQKKFYEVFKSKFSNGIYLDLKGNSNYSFILLFDLLNEYETHKDLVKLESQFNALGKFYPKTKTCARDFLLKKIGESGNEKGIERLKSQDNYTYGVYSRDYIDEYHLGNKYAKKLKLNQEEISWLNKFWNPNNVFISIEGCCIATIKLYLEIIKGLNTQLKDKGTSIAKEVDFFQSKIVKLYKANNNYDWGDYDISYLKSRAESEVFGTIFKRAESKLRELFDHKRKISSDFPYSDNKLQQEFENRVGEEVNKIILSVAQTVNIPDEITEIELNAQNVNRWKITFEKLKESFTEQSKEKLIKAIHDLEKVNQKNPSIENIFYEASKFIAKFDKVNSLKFYIYYLYYDLKSDKVDNKQLNKTIQKNLFKNNEQLKDFEIIVAELVKSKNLKNAITQIENIYEPKRKKIKLDKTAIKEVQKQDKGTVEILSEYLKDEYEDENTSIKTEEINNEEVKIEITNKSENQYVSPFSVTLNQIQSETLFLFTKNSFSISHSQIESFCKLKNIFKGQLIDSINESCYETLDDVIIEENGESYILNETYYQKISAK